MSHQLHLKLVKELDLLENRATSLLIDFLKSAAGVFGVALALAGF